MFCFPALQASAVDYSTAVVAGKRLTVCRIDLTKEPLQLFLKDDSGRMIHRFDRLSEILKAKGKKLVFAMNAGMFHPGHEPVGLFVSEGRQWTPLNTANDEGNFFLKPNGVFLIGESGAQVVETSEYPKIRGQVQLATQSGPMLVHRGQIHPAFRADSTSRLHRNGVGALSPTVVVFVNAEDPVNFHEFASFFRDSLKCQNALFLDGTLNSLHAEKLGRSDFRMNLGPIIGIAE